MLKKFKYCSNTVNRNDKFRTRMYNVTMKLCVLTCQTGWYGPNCNNSTYLLWKRI